MTIEIATLAAGVLIMVGAIIAGGAIYAGLEKLADVIKKQELYNQKNGEMLRVISPLALGFESHLARRKDPGRFHALFIDLGRFFLNILFGST